MDCWAADAPSELPRRGPAPGGPYPARQRVEPAAGPWNSWGWNRNLKPASPGLNWCTKPPTMHLVLRAGRRGQAEKHQAALGYIGAVWFEELDQFSARSRCAAPNGAVGARGPSLVIEKLANPPALPGDWANRRYARQPKPAVSWCIPATASCRPTGWANAFAGGPACGAPTSGPIATNIWGRWWAAEPSCSTT